MRRLVGWLSRIEERLTPDRGTVTFDGFASLHDAERACHALARDGITATASDAETGPIVLVSRRYAARAARDLDRFRTG